MEMNEITRRINSIIKMTEGIDKDIEVFDLQKYLLYLSSLKVITKDEYKKHNDFIESLFPISCANIENQRTKEKNEFFCERDNLTDLYKEVLLFSKNYNLHLEKVEPTNINDYEHIIISFLKWFDKEMLELYENIKNKGLIHNLEHRTHLGEATSFGKNNNAIFLNDKQDGIHKLFTIIHEMAHIYCFNKMRDNKILIPNLFTMECVSKSLEKLLYVFIMENNFINKTILNKFANNRLLSDLIIADSSYVFNKMSKDKESNEFYIKDYSIFDYQRYTILYPSTFQYYSVNFSYHQNKYSYAHLFSSVMEERFMYDPTWTKKLLRDYQLLINELNDNQILNMFDRSEYINATNNYTDKILTKKKK